MALPSVRQLADAVQALLDAHATLTVYGSVVDPPPPVDVNGVTMGYAVFHPFAGDATPSSIALQPGRLLWEFQVSCAGGNRDYCLWVVDTVRSLLDGKTITLSGVAVGLMVPPLGYQPPPPQVSPLESGQRLQVPLLYQVLTAA